MLKIVESQTLKKEYIDPLSIDRSIDLLQKLNIHSNLSISKTCTCNPRILIIDDSKLNLLPLRHFISQANFDNKILKTIMNASNQNFASAISSQNDQEFELYISNGSFVKVLKDPREETSQLDKNKSSEKSSSLMSRFSDLKSMEKSPKPYGGI